MESNSCWSFGYKFFWRNALSPLSLTLVGKLIDVNEEHPLNADLPISSRVEGKVTEIKEEHPLN